MSQSLVQRLLFILIMSGLTALCTGCAPKPFTGPLPPGTTLQTLPSFDTDTPPGWHPSGQSFVATQGGLIRYELANGRSTPIDPLHPQRLVWSPDGNRLAVAYTLDGTTHVIVHTADMKRSSETRLAGELDSLLWSKDTGLLVITTRLKLYSFGADLSIDLTRWDGNSAPHTIVLHNATIKPATARAWQQQLIAGSQATLSPEQDELLYLRLHDPPALQGNARLVLHHIETGTETAIAPLPLDTRTVAFIDSERALVDAGSGGSVELFFWSENDAINWPYPGGVIAISPGGHYWLVGGVLLHDGKQIGNFPDVQQALFSPDGRHLLMQIRSRWYLLGGLAEPPPRQISSEDRLKLRQLRSWRSRGLITPQDYQVQKSGILKP